MHDTFLHRYAFVLSDDPDRLDMDWVVDFLATTNWGKLTPKALRRQALVGSHCYGLYAPDASPAGFIRIISDGAMFGWIGDFFILPEHRGRGLGRWTLATLFYSSRFRSICNWQLSTNDKQTLYRRFGFEVFEGNGEFMTLSRSYTSQTQEETP